MQFPNEEQCQLIKNYIVLPFVLRVFQRDLNVIGQSPLKTKVPYLEMLNQILERIVQDIAITKRGLRSAGIYIYSQNQNESSVDYEFKFKGYHHCGSFVWDVMRIEVQQYMKGYLCKE
jgi:hypothetical protein